MDKKILSPLGKQVGRLTNKGQFYDSLGNNVGHMPLNNNIVYSTLGKKIGYIESNGNFRDNMGKLLGVIDKYQK